MPSSTAPNQGLREFLRRLQESVGMEDTKKIRASTYSRTDTHISSQKTWQHVQGLHEPDGALALRGNVDMNSLP